MKQGNAPLDGCSFVVEPARRLRILIVDDSPTMCRVLKDFIDRERDMVTVGCAGDAYEAREKIKMLEPDIITLDIAMPRMNGMDFLERLMRLRPMPVLMVSSWTSKGSELAERALQMGAIDVVSKPAGALPVHVEAMGEDLILKLRQFAQRQGPVRAGASSTRSRLQMDPDLAARTLICIGGSTGGTEALRVVLAGLPENCPPVLVAQHMPQSYTGSFAQNLDAMCAARVKEAEHGERILPGVVYIAPGRHHLQVLRAVGQYQVRLSSAPPRHGVRPSVDVLFESAADQAGRQALGILLTGMGRDGAHGMLRLHAQGAHTIAQDEASSAVFGMPKAAIALGAAREVLPLDQIAAHLIAHLNALRRPS